MSLSSLLPTAHAQGLSSITQVEQTGKLIGSINTNIVSTIGVLLLALTIVTFFAGVVRFIWAVREGDTKAAQGGKRFMLWSLLAVFVVFSIYGIIIFMQTTLLGKRAETTIAKPCLNFVSGCTGGGESSSGGTPSTSSGTSGVGSSDDCVRNNRSAGDACIMSGGATGKCTDIFGSLSCQSASIGNQSGECSPKTEGDTCIINGQKGTCKNVGLQSVCSLGGVFVTTDDQDCNKAGESCQGTDSGGAVVNGTCKSNGAGGFYCDVPRPNAIVSPCGGKSFGDTCNAGGGATGQCIRKDTTSALYCAVMVGNSDPNSADTSTGSVILKEGDGCVNGTTNKVCGAGLSCSYKKTVDGNDYYTCQK